jgi:hypothetical protein
MKRSTIDALASSPTCGGRFERRVDFARELRGRVVQFPAMIIDDPNDLDDFERKLRFEEIAAEFGRSIAAMECAPWIDTVALAARHRLICPEASAIATWTDDEVSALIWRVIEFLAAQNTYFSETDHLSDRELYVELWESVLAEPTKDWEAVLEPDEIRSPSAWACHFSMLDDFSDPAVARLYARYYLPDDHKDRNGFLADFLEPGEPLPPYEQPPFDRDRFMPERPMPIEDDGWEETNTKPRSEPPPRPRRRGRSGDRPFTDDDIPF